MFLFIAKWFRWPVWQRVVSWVPDPSALFWPLPAFFPLCHNDSETKEGRQKRINCGCWTLIISTMALIIFFKLLRPEGLSLKRGQYLTPFYLCVGISSFNVWKCWQAITSGVPHRPLTHPFTEDNVLDSPKKSTLLSGQSISQKQFVMMCHFLGVFEPVAAATEKKIIMISFNPQGIYNLKR